MNDPEKKDPTQMTDAEIEAEIRRLTREADAHARHATMLRVEMESRVLAGTLPGDES
jgi:hypothetical protein